MNECKFEVGDKVRRTSISSSPELYGTKGGIYTVSAISKSKNVDTIFYLRLEEFPRVQLSSIKFELVERPSLFPEELFEL